jgi:hypothetical protein
MQGSPFTQLEAITPGILPRGAYLSPRRPPAAQHIASGSTPQLLEETSLRLIETDLRGATSSGVMKEPPEGLEVALDRCFVG